MKELLRWADLNVNLIKKAWWPDLMKALRGHARSHFDSVHEGIKYDLRLDTAEFSPEECAKQIQVFLKETKRLTTSLEKSQ